MSMTKHHGYLLVRLVQVVRPCDRCYLPQPLDALRRTPSGLYLCADGASCRARLFENVRTA